MHFFIYNRFNKLGLLVAYQQWSKENRFFCRNPPYIRYFAIQISTMVIFSIIFDRFMRKDFWMDIKNKRKFARITTNIPCELIDPTSTYVTENGFIVDFSFGGLAVATRAKIDIADHPLIKIKINDKDFFISVTLVNERKIMSDVYIYGFIYSRITFIRRLKMLWKLSKLTDR